MEMIKHTIPFLERMIKVIVRERETEYVMIEQDNHADISKEMISEWADDYFYGKKFRTSVEYAIANHDVGWHELDTEPFWDDVKQAPYNFLDFPTAVKTVFYKHGIDQVAKNDLYAARLCSEHYTRFLLRSESTIAKDFVSYEKNRQQKIETSLPHFDADLFHFHYKLLQLCDNLSLFICLNEPGVAAENIHYFFRNGIPFDPIKNPLGENKINLNWNTRDTITMDIFPFHQPLSVTVKQKKVTKDSIKRFGLKKAYKKAPYEKGFIHLQKKK